LEITIRNTHFGDGPKQERRGGLCRLRSTSGCRNCTAAGEIVSKQQRTVAVIVVWLKEEEEVYYRPSLEKIEPSRTDVIDFEFVGRYGYKTIMSKEIAQLFKQYRNGSLDKGTALVYSTVSGAGKTRSFLETK